MSALATAEPCRTRSTCVGVGATLGDGPLTIGRGAFVGVGIA